MVKGLARRLRRLLGVRDRPGYSFRPALSIRSQTMTFVFGGHEIQVLAGHSTPLYETIAEVVDYDCYQFARLPLEVLESTTLVDIGANIGVTTLCLAQFPECQVLSFEPNPDSCARLEANLRANHLSNVTVVRMAVCGSSGAGLLARPAHEDVGCRLTDRDDRPDGLDVIEVPTVDLAGAIAHAPDPIGLVKIDCEGAEHDIVEHMTPELARRLPRLTLEVHDRGPGRNHESLSGQLERLGYALTFKPDPFGRPSLTHVLAERRDR